MIWMYYYIDIYIPYAHRKKKLNRLINLEHLTLKIVKLQALYS